MRFRVVFIISLVLIGFGCRSIEPAPIYQTITKTDTFIKSDTVFNIHPEILSYIWELENMPKKDTAEIRLLQAKIDSLKSRNPITKTIVKNRVVFVKNDIHHPGEVLVQVQKKVHPITYVSFGFGILCLITAIYFRYGLTRLRTGKGDW